MVFTGGEGVGPFFSRLDKLECTKLLRVFLYSHLRWNLLDLPGEIMQVSGADLAVPTDLAVPMRPYKCSLSPLVKKSHDRFLFSGGVRGWCK